MHWFIKFSIGIATFLLIILLVLLLPKILPAKKVSNSLVRGFIIQNQVWEGTVRVVGDIVSLPSAEVSIKPGTRILVAKKEDKFNLDLLPWHLKSGINTKGFDHGVYKNEPFWDEGQKIQIHFGKLSAVGTVGLPITIKSDGIANSPYDINVISFDSGVISNTNLSNYRRLEVGKSVTVRDSVIKDVGECGVCISSGSPSIINNIFSDIDREAIWIEGASPRITDNLFTNLSGEGVKIDPKRRGAPVISFNTFEMPDNIALDILSGMETNSGVVSFNKFSGNSKMKIACDSKIRINQNILLSLIVFGGSGCGGRFVFGPNFWGSNNLRTILSEQITNKDKKFEVLIPSLMDSPPSVVGSRIRY